jgi:hypothetical protein
MSEPTIPLGSSYTYAVNAEEWGKNSGAEHALAARGMPAAAFWILARQWQQSTAGNGFIRGTPSAANERCDLPSPWVVVVVAAGSLFMLG